MTIDLYLWATPNGRKVSIMLEELKVPYVEKPVNIANEEQFAPEFLAISPNNRIPAIVDHDGPGGKPVLFSSGAILLYLGEKEGRLLERSEETYFMSGMVNVADGRLRANAWPSPSFFGFFKGKNTL